MQRESHIEYLLDVLLYGTAEEKKALVAEQRKEVMRLEQRFAEHTAGHDHGGSQGNLQWYTDDGYSGANFQRPGFQAMLADIEAGKVGTVIVKDMSRLGRNYLQVGMYTETLWTRAQKADRETGC